MAIYQLMYSAICKSKKIEKKKNPWTQISIEMDSRIWLDKAWCNSGILKRRVSLKDDCYKFISKMNLLFAATTVCSGQIFAESALHSMTFFFFLYLWQHRLIYSCVTGFQSIVILCYFGGHLLSSLPVDGSPTRKPRAESYLLMTGGQLSSCLIGSISGWAGLELHLVSWWYVAVWFEFLMFYTTC